MANGPDPFFTIIGFIIVIIIVLVMASGFKIIQPYEQGLAIQLGTFKRILNSGMNWVVPFITRVIKLDLRTQVFDVPRQEVITKDNSPTHVDAIIYIRVTDPKRAFFEITNYRVATIALAQTTLRARIGDMELDQILYDRHTINTQLRDELDKATDPWGVKVENVEIREVDPVGPVKAAMEEQTAAERERRAQILRADGKKRASILEAEGAKQSRILAAEGVRMSQILEAEGSRAAKILEMQGEAQALRILTLGASLMDDKALTIKSLDTLSIMANGKATKIIFPFEISKLMEGASEFIGGGRSTPKSTVTDYNELESKIGKSDDILGEIPKPGELKKEIKAIESLAQSAATLQSVEELSKNPEDIRDLRAVEIQAPPKHVFSAQTKTARKKKPPTR